MHNFGKRFITVFTVTGFLVSLAYAYDEKDLAKQAQQIEAKLNRSVPACDNFYEFACGNYQPEIPRHKASIVELEIIKDTLLEQLNEVFKAPQAENDSNPIRNVKTYYSNCMDTETIESAGLSPIKELLSELGDWPVIAGSEWNESSWRWQDAAIRMETMGFVSNFLFDVGISPDFKNTTKRVMSFDQPSLGLSKEYFSKGLDHELVRAYKEYQVDFAVIFGAQPEDAKQQMNEVLMFEKSLADISLAKEDRRNSTKLYNPIKLGDLQVIFPGLNLVDYINIFVLPSDRVDSDETVVVANQTFYAKLHELLETTPSRTIANYMMWRASASVSSHLNKEIRTRRLEYLKVVSGILDYEPRWKECVGKVAASLPIASSALYVKNHFDEKSKTIASEMVQGIREQFVDNLNTVDWMDDETKKFAFKKIEKMTNHIGYPAELVDDNVLAGYYANLTLDKNEFLHSYLKLNRFHVANAMKKFRLPVNKTEWELHSNVAIANAYYFWQQNSITIPAGILQGNFFSVDRPNYMNYGAIGLVIGHEITHGFDDQGRQFDFDGNLVDWWRDDTKRAYLDKARCIIEQYGNYTEPLTQLKLNGISTQGENIADNGGVLFAYRAYQKWMEQNGVEMAMPGLNFTPNQLFWISVAQSWCSVYRVEDLKHKITTGVHSIARFRIIGPLSNIKEFSDDFQCPADSPMSPSNRCKVW